MRVLLDENTSRSPGRALIGHECSSVSQLGWQGTKNGALLRRPESAGFEVLITLDDDLPAEQNIKGRSIAILILKPGRQGKAATLELADQILSELPKLSAGAVAKIRPNG